MKALYALLIILLLSLYKAETCLSTTKPSKASECNSRLLKLININAVIFT